MKYAVFTDLDGTLLDLHDFSFEPAAGMVARLRAEGIPLIIVTSKTMAEVAPLADELQLHGPVIVESGGAIAMRADDRLWAYIPLGVPAAEIRKRVPRIEQKAEAKLVLYSSMSLEDAELVSGLSGDMLKRSMQREFDEPFLLAEGLIQRVEAAAEEEGLIVRQGGRFHHLCGPSGKGDAVRRVLSSLDEKPIVIALGDAPMDAEFLTLADIPIVMRGSDGLPNEALLALVPHASISPEKGPAGWSRALEELLDRRTKENDARGRN